MTPEDLAAYAKTAAIVLGMLFGPYGVWVLMQKRVTDLEVWKADRLKSDEAAKQEAERQMEAWWDKIDKLKANISDLDKTCSVTAAELQTAMKNLTGRMDAHTGSNIANFAEVVRNYNDMVIQTLDALKETLRAKG